MAMTKVDAERMSKAMRWLERGAYTTPTFLPTPEAQTLVRAITALNWRGTPALLAEFLPRLLAARNTASVRSAMRFAAADFDVRVVAADYLAHLWNDKAQASGMARMIPPIVNSARARSAAKILKTKFDGESFDSAAHTALLAADGKPIAMLAAVESIEWAIDVYENTPAGVGLQYLRKLLERVCAAAKV